MPYLKDMNRRAECDKVVKVMEEVGVKADGDLNYILFKYFKYNVERRYNSMKNYCGELNEAAEQIRTEFLHPYEKALKKKMVMYYLDRGQCMAIVTGVVASKRVTGLKLCTEAADIERYGRGAPCEPVNPCIP